MEGKFDRWRCPRRSPHRKIHPNMQITLKSISGFLRYRYALNTKKKAKQNERRTGHLKLTGSRYRSPTHTLAHTSQDLLLQTSGFKKKKAWGRGGNCIATSKRHSSLGVGPHNHPHGTDRFDNLAKKKWQRVGLNGSLVWPNLPYPKIQSHL